MSNNSSTSNWNTLFWLKPDLILSIRNIYTSIPTYACLKNSVAGGKASKLKICLIALAKFCSTKKASQYPALWATARYFTHISLSYPSSNCFLTCLFSSVCSAWELLLWSWKVFGKNGFIEYMIRGIVWSEGFLKGFSVEDFLWKQISLGDWGDRRFVVFVDRPLDVNERKVCCESRLYWNMLANILKKTPKTTKSEVASHYLNWKAVPSATNYVSL